MCPNEGQIFGLLTAFISMKRLNIMNRPYVSYKGCAKLVCFTEKNEKCP